MNDKEISPMETTTTTAPEFALAMRGYDRLQVDEFIARFDRWMAEATARTEEAEADQAEARREIDTLRRRLAEVEAAGPADPDALQQAGVQIQQMLQSALGECDGIRLRAEQEAEASISMARETAVDIVSRARTTVEQLQEAAKSDRRDALAAKESAVSKARDEAAEIVADAERRRARILEAAEQHRRSVAEDVSRLIRQRDQVLTSLRSALDGASTIDLTDQLRAEPEDVGR
jgi:cell division septum initiation protein DivIVA